MRGLLLVGMAVDVAAIHSTAKSGSSSSRSALVGVCRMRSTHTSARESSGYEQAIARGKERIATLVGAE
jgi:hypothetical protein